MRERIRKLPFRKKLLYFYLCVLALIAGGILFYTIQQAEYLMELDRDYMQQSNQQINLTIQMVENNAKKLRYLHFADETMETMLARPASRSSKEQLQEEKEHINGLLAAQADLDPYILRATIETEDGRVFQSLVSDETGYLEKMKRVVRRKEWIGRNQIVYTDVKRQSINMVEYETVTMISPLYDMIRKEPLGILYVDLDFGKLKEELDTLRQGAGTPAGFAVISRDEVLYHSQQKEEGEYPVRLDAGLLFRQLEAASKGEESKETLEIDNRKCRISAVSNEEAGWILLQYRPDSQILFALLPDMIKITGILSAVWLVLLMAGVFVVNRVSRPVKILSDVMGKVGTNKNGELPVIDGKENIWEDEMGVLVRSYNEMAQRINENIIRTYQAELEQKRTELKMLQFQINPHFLYNALNTVSSIAVLENVDYIPQIADSLSDMFRYNIKGSDFVTVADEVRQTENYLRIQKIRFPERFDVTIAIPDEVMECGVVKFILQPVVENSIHHGFAVRRKKDRLKITGRKEGEEIWICVEDDGVGMEPEQVRELNRRMEESGAVSELTENARSIGLSNVNARLRYFYGEEYGIRVESRRGEFTRILLKFRTEKRLNTGGEQ